MTFNEEGISMKSSNFIDFVIKVDEEIVVFVVALESSDVKST